MFIVMVFFIETNALMWEILASMGHFETIAIMENWSQQNNFVGFKLFANRFSTENFIILRTVDIFCKKMFAHKVIDRLENYLLCFKITPWGEGDRRDKFKKTTKPVERLRKAKFLTSPRAIYNSSADWENGGWPSDKCVSPGAKLG